MKESDNYEDVEGFPSSSSTVTRLSDRQDSRPDL
jgi:hypothetical protein